MCVRRLICLGVLMALVSGARADLLTINFAMSGAEEVPPNNSEAVGAGQLIFNTETRHFTIDMVVFGITLQELLGVGPNNSPAHIHMAPAGANGPIVVDLGFLAGGFQQSGLGIRLQIPDALFGGVQGGVNSDPATNAAALLAGNLYVNVHTQEFPGGEIRAQIPEPAALALLGVGLALQARRRR